MSAQFIAHTIYLISATALTYIWTSSPTASPYTLQLVAVLILIYFVLHFLNGRKPRRSHYPQGIITIDLIILIITVLLVVTQTGALSSPFFFTIYFILFAVALLLEIEATLVLTGTLLSFFTLHPSTDLIDTLHITHLVSMLMITPLAIFTAHQHESKIIEERKRQILDLQIQEDETDILMFLSLNLKRTLLSSLDKLSLLIPKSRGESRNDLTSLYQDLRDLYRASNELQQSVDQKTDKS